MVVLLLFLLPAARFECRLNRAIVGTDGLIRTTDVHIMPGLLSLSIREVAVLEAFGLDEFGGEVTVSLDWSSADPAVAQVAPRRGRTTVVSGRRPGETVVTGTHPLSGAADTVPVTVRPLDDND